MQLISWHPDLKRNAGPDSYIFQLSIAVRCITCRTIFKFSTGPQNLPTEPSDTLLQEIIQASIQEAAYPLSCKHCGVTQNFPPQEVSRLRQEIEPRLTIDWLKTEYEQNM